MSNEVGQDTPIVIDVIYKGKYRDGGTEHYADADGKNYFIDNRIGSSTCGSIFDRYPGADGAGILENYRLNILESLL